LRYLLDTCLVSELVRVQPDPAVTAWIREQQEHHLFLSVLTLGELRKGIERLADGKKREHLANWLDGELKLRFMGRILPIDDEVAERWGILSARAGDKGLAMPVLDGLIAATALVHGMTVVTRNVGDMQSSGVLIYSPWS